MTENLISATIVADSINVQGNRITTFELVFPRFILAELNTHRVFSKNSASSRAIPFSKMVKEVEERPFIPIAWQKHHSGMQGSEYIVEEEDLRHPIATWLRGRDYQVQQAKLLYNNCEVTKQLCNRMLEPYMYHKVLLTATEFDNFFELRCPQYEMGNQYGFKSWKELSAKFEENGDYDLLSFTTIQKLKANKGEAEIHIMDLAEKMYDALKESTPKLLKANEWHIPYGDNIDKKALKELLFLQTGEIHNREEDLQAIILKIATARCARLSYQTLGDEPKIDYKKDLELYDSLLTSGHWSPFEHCAQAMSLDYILENPLPIDLSLDASIDVGGGQLQVNYYSTVSTEDPQEMPTTWCRNFQGWIQFRAYLD